MTVYLGNAWSDERGKSKGGESGNQNGKELRIVKWYKTDGKPWRVFRTDAEAAERIAYAMEAACKNPNIGYDQSDRNTLYEVSKPLGFDTAKVDTPCECDCSSLVRVCVLYSGISVPNFSTSSEAKRLLATGRFTEMHGERYTDEPNYLKRGDILVKQGHTAVVLNDGEKAEKPDPKPEQKPTTHEYVKVRGGSVRVREGNGTMFPSIGTAHRGDLLPCYGQADADPYWYEVDFNGKRGFISCNKRYTEVVYKA